MYWETALIGAVVIILLYILHTFFNRPKNFPPGPFPLPVIGSIHKLGDKPNVVFKELSRKYGDVFSIYLGHSPVIIVNSYNTAKEVLIEKGADFAGRPSGFIKALVTRGYQDIAFDDYGPRWKQARKVAHRALKLYGLGKVDVEKIITKQIEELLERLQRKVDQTFNPHEDFGLAVTNVICAIVFGSNYDMEDEEFRTIMYYNKQIFSTIGGANAVDYLPWLRFFQNKNIEILKESVKLRDAVLERWLRYHKETFKEGNLRDVTDALIEGAKEERENNDGNQKYFTDDHIIMIMSDLFNAGIETVTTTLRWAIIYFVHWPRVQQKVQEELDFVTGNKRVATLTDRESLPYLQATIHEIGRLAAVSPFFLTHKTTCNTSISGYSIPKNTQVLINAFAIHHDEREWEEPEEFYPERWLDENGHFVPVRDKAYLPFSAGPRVCFGEVLAKCELFLFISHILQKFSFEMLPGSEDEHPKLEGNIGLTHEPQPFNIILRKRT